MQRPFHVTLTVFTLLLGWAVWVTPVQAGGGSVTPINFAEAQQITGKSFSPELAVKDPSSGYSAPWVGHEFQIHAHGDLAGANCDTTQGTSDSQGRIKANCHADVLGKFSFDIYDVSAGSNVGTFSVYFTESGSGFSDQGSTGQYTVAISRGSFTTTPNTVFKLEAILKKDGQVTTNYDEVQYFRWEVLQGSIVSLSSEAAKNQALNFKTTDLGKMTLRAVAVMNNGSSVESGAIVITTSYGATAPSVERAASPTPTPNSPQSSPQSSPQPTPASTPSLKKIEVPITTTAVATASASPSAEMVEALQAQVNQLQTQVENQKQQLNFLQSTVKKLSDFISHLFGRN